MVRAKGPVWHQKQKSQGIIPKGLTGLDRDATWSKSKADGWVYGHGTFALVTHGVPVLGIFQWMPNSGNEAKRMGQEVARHDKSIEQVFMDSKADDQKLYFGLKQEHQIQLVTVPRTGMNKSASRRQMIKEMLTRKNKREFRQRSITVEPMQGLVANIFDLERCWMRGNDNNRWLFAAMGVAVQIAQLHAHRRQKSTWNIKSEVLGV